MGKTLFEKIWDSHYVGEEGGQTVLYIDRHLTHEVTTPQAYEGLKISGRPVRRPGPHSTMAVVDHCIPTQNQLEPIADPIARLQVETLRKNCKEFGVTLFDVGDPRNGITLFEKIWDSHYVGEEGGQTVLYIDRHLTHEVTTPQAYEGLKISGRPVRRPGPHSTMAVVDHCIPTQNQLEPIADPIARLQVETLRKNCKEFGLNYGNSILE